MGAAFQRAMGWLVALGAAGWAGAAGPSFQEVARLRGVEFQHVRALEERFWFPEIMSGGAAWIDYDTDGDLDLYLVQGGALPGEAAGEPPGNRLYRNDGPAGFVEVTAAAGVGDAGYGMGAAVGDVDGDGAADLYVTNVGANVLFLNRGDGTFRRAVAGVEDAGWGSSAALFDADRDGDLDLFVVNYVAWSAENEVQCYSGGVRDYCHPNRYNAPQADRFYRNRGDGAFDDASREAGFGGAFGNGLGVTPLDFDGDGWLDLYVANDGMPNQLWINRGDGTFTDRAVELGCAVNMSGAAEAGMGVASGDVDGDGRFDLLLSHLRHETNTLYLNRGGFCDDATVRAGLAAPSINRTGFGAGLVDFDLDGWLDLFIANGRVGVAESELVAGNPYAEPDLLFAGEAGGRFRLLPSAATGDRFGNGRAAAFGDFDDDGAVDIAVMNNGGRLELLRNLSDGRRAWLRVAVMSRAGAEAPGARVTVEAAGRVQHRQAEGAYSYCAANQVAAAFGLGEAPGVETLTVQWASGEARRILRLPVRRAISVYP